MQNTVVLICWTSNNWNWCLLANSVPYNLLSLPRSYQCQMLKINGITKCIAIPCIESPDEVPSVNRLFLEKILIRLVAVPVAPSDEMSPCCLGSWTIISMVRFRLYAPIIDAVHLKILAVLPISIESNRQLRRPFPLTSLLIVWLTWRGFAGLWISWTKGPTLSAAPAPFPRWQSDTFVVRKIWVFFQPVSHWL